MTLEDNDLMPFGIHQNEKMANVPDKWLISYYADHRKQFERGSPTLRASSIAVMEYIKDSFEDLP